MTFQRTENAASEGFFIKYRKILSVLSIILLVFFPYEIYKAPAFTQAHIFRFIGYWLDTVLTYLIVPLGMLIYIRKAFKEHNKGILISQKKLNDNAIR